MSGSREAMLASVRAALGPATVVPEVPRAYRAARADGVGHDPVTVDLFCERVADYRATVKRVRGDELPGALLAACQERRAGRIAVPGGAPAWTIDGVELVRDDPPLSPRQLDELDGVLSGCALAIAETGTIVLDGVGPSGRRALTLVPDYHLCVVRSEDIVASVPDAVAALAAVAAEGRPITFISGPSATVDIELVRVEGVHGPRTLDVLVVESPTSRRE
ncbi:MAG: LutC/YkgG family protein [Solirubrobacteraceae bacterium]